MEINKEISEVLKQFKIDKDAGIQVLLGIYYKLDVDKVCPEEVIKAINLTKIIEKDYKTGLIQWNIPLFDEQQTEWGWVREWNDRWNLDRSRKASLPDVTKRMQEFFRKYPSYRSQDVLVATDNYFASQTSPGYLKNSAAFIFDGAGLNKKSILLSWCEKLKESGSTDSNNRGRVLK